MKESLYGTAEAVPFQTEAILYSSREAISPNSQ